jgi:hypothetical protein
MEHLDIQKYSEIMYLKEPLHSPIKGAFVLLKQWLRLIRSLIEVVSNINKDLFRGTRSP